MQFIQTVHYGWIPVSRIISINTFSRQRFDARGDKKIGGPFTETEVKFDDGDGEIVTAVASTSVEEGLGDIVPASPGYFVIHLDDEDDSVIKMPVIAWRINCYNSGVKPIIIEDDDEDDPFILCPNGEVKSFWEWHPDIESCKEALIQRRKENKKTKRRALKNKLLEGEGK